MGMSLGASSLWVTGTSTGSGIPEGENIASQIGNKSELQVTANIVPPPTMAVDPLSMSVTLGRSHSLPLDSLQDASDRLMQ
jgi:hypothetical protein